MYVIWYHPKEVMRGAVWDLSGPECDYPTLKEALRGWWGFTTSPLRKGIH
jgi:hypothetical protein